MFLSGCLCGNTHVLNLDADHLTVDCPHCQERHDSPTFIDWGSGPKPGKDGTPTRRPAYTYTAASWPPCMNKERAIQDLKDWVETRL